MTSDKPNDKPPKDDKGKDSKTEVYRGWKGPRKTASFKCNEELWKRCVNVFQREFGSVCHPMEAILAAILGVVQDKVYSSRTITIEKLEVVRALRPRRYEEPVSEPDLVVEDFGDPGKCGLCGTGAVVEVFYWPGERKCSRVFLCRQHWAEAQKKRDFVGKRML